MVCAFHDLFNKTVFCKVTNIFCSVSFGSFIVLGCLFRSIIHLSIVLEYDVTVNIHC